MFAMPCIEVEWADVRIVQKADRGIGRGQQASQPFRRQRLPSGGGGLVHAAGIDGSISQIERDKLHVVIKQRFSLDDAAADELVAEATAAEQEAIDLYKFTAQLNRSLDETGRARIVEMMWQIAYADGGVTEFEDNLIWRAADLLGVSRDERIALRERVAGQQTADRAS
jgi:uncharacterized tellurite resistance protein B-like protein